MKAKRPGNGHDKPVVSARSVLTTEERCFLTWALAANEAGLLTPAAHERVRTLIARVRDAEAQVGVSPSILGGRK